MVHLANCKTLHEKQLRLCLHQLLRSSPKDLQLRDPLQVSELLCGDL